MMDRCPDEELLSARLDDAVDGAEARQVDAHLAACSQCRERRDRLCAVREALRSLPSRQIPPRVARAAVHSAARDRARRIQRVRAGMLTATVALALVTSAVLDHQGLASRGDEPMEVRDGARIIEAMDREQLVDAVARERIPRVPTGALEHAGGEGAPAVLDLVDDPADAPDGARGDPPQ